MLLCLSSLFLRLWRNWQTHQTQNLTLVTACGFESHQPHFLEPCLLQGSFFMLSFYLNRSLRENMDYSPDVHTSFKFKQYNNGIR